MASSDISKAIWKRGVLYVGTAGSTASTPLGYISRETGVTATMAKSVERYLADNLPGAIASQTTEITNTVEGALIQFETDVLKYLFGATNVGTVFTLGGESFSDLQFAVRVIGELRDGTFFTYSLPYAQSVGDFVAAFSTSSLTEVGFMFEAQDDATLPPTAYTLTTSTATISSGVLTRVSEQGYILANGEGSTTDDLDSITGASLVNEEILILQISSVDAPISLIHVLDTLELTGAVDWTMTKLDDRITLQYLSADTAWHEIGRHDA